MINNYLMVHIRFILFIIIILILAVCDGSIIIYYINY